MEVQSPLPVVRFRTSGIIYLFESSRQGATGRKYRGGLAGWALAGAGSTDLSTGRRIRGGRRVLVPITAGSPSASGRSEVDGCVASPADVRPQMPPPIRFDSRMKWSASPKG